MHPRNSAAWPADRPSRGTLLLLHAFPLGARMWEPQHALAEHGWHIVMPQFRGFDCGTPDTADAASMDDYASDVEDLMETLGIASAVVGGLSMGGYVALALYRRAPERFRAMVLADTRAEADSADARMNRTRLIALAADGGTEAVADDMLPKLLGRSTAAMPHIEARVRALIAVNQPASLQAALRAMMTREDSTTLLPRISVPALILVGEEDSLTPPQLSSSMAASIPDATLVVLPAAGHLSNIEQPHAFNAAVLRFVDGLDGIADC
jgi:3-oxoadipate enol-lactonase